MHITTWVEWLVTGSFTLLVCLAILALFTRYAGVVLVLTLYAVIWQIVGVVGASLLLAIILVVTAICFRAVTFLVSDSEVEPALFAPLLDDLLVARDRWGHDDQDRHDHHIIRAEMNQLDTTAATNIDEWR